MTTATSNVPLVLAHLIAAAPELLALLQETIDMWGSAGFDPCGENTCTCVQQQIRSTIAKAEGR